MPWKKGDHVEISKDSSYYGVPGLAGTVVDVLGDLVTMSVEFDPGCVPVKQKYTLNVPDRNLIESTCHGER